MKPFVINYTSIVDSIKLTMFGYHFLKIMVLLTYVLPIYATVFRLFKINKPLEKAAFSTLLCYLLFLPSVFLIVREMEWDAFRQFKQFYILETIYPVIFIAISTWVINKISQIHRLNMIIVNSFVYFLFVLLKFLVIWFLVPFGISVFWGGS